LRVHIGVNGLVMFVTIFQKVILGLVLVK